MDSWWSLLLFLCLFDLLQVLLLDFPGCHRFERNVRVFEMTFLTSSVELHVIRSQSEQGSLDKHTFSSDDVGEGRVKGLTARG